MAELHLVTIKIWSKTEDRIIPGGGVMGADANMGRGTVTCPCGNILYLHAIGVVSCTKCGLMLKFEDTE